MSEQRQDSGGLEDLPWRVQAAAAAGFFGLWALIAFTPRLWGSDVLYERFYFVGAGLAVLWWPAVASVGPRLAERDQVRAAARATATGVLPTKLIRKVRRRAWLHSLRRGSVLLVLPSMILLLVAGQSASAYDADLIASQPKVSATVVTSYRSPLAGRAEGPEVTVELPDGRREVIGLSFPGEGSVEPGDRIDVVVDPDDPEYVIAANSHEDWAYTWWGGLVIGGGIAVLLGGMWTLWALCAPARAALREARSARHVEDVTVTGRAGEDAIVIVDVRGQRWTWTADMATWDGPVTGPLRAVGAVRGGA